MHLLHLTVFLTVYQLGITRAAIEGSCMRECNLENCREKSPSLVPRYLFYDVNVPEGFNLRRDVYMRMAIFVQSLRRSGEDWHLVLPPWQHLYHWRSADISNQNFLPWHTFFDVASMKRFAPVMELYEFFQETKQKEIDTVFVLQHYKDAFSSSDWSWEDRWNLNECDDRALCFGGYCGPNMYFWTGDKGEYEGWFWGYGNMSAREVRCVSFQGPASLLRELLDSQPNHRYVMVDHAEVLVHDRFGDATYWACRRSMRFAKELVAEAALFRETSLNSSDQADLTLRPHLWHLEKAGRSGLGGPYLCSHLRRADFLHGREDQVPSLEWAAEQINTALARLHLGTVFLASDASQQEVEQLKTLLGNKNLLKYEPDAEKKQKYKDGGTAIIDQIICSHARYFIGTHESTFTFRIQEEREIMGLPVSSTFNVFCASPEKCFESTRWQIVFENS